MKHSFTLVLNEKEITQELEDKLFEAGCDDATIAISNGSSVELDFDREAESLEQAIASARDNVTNAGYEIRLCRIEDAKTRDEDKAIVNEWQQQRRTLKQLNT